MAVPAEINLAVTVNTKPQDVRAQKAHSFPLLLLEYLSQSISIAREDHTLRGTSSITAPSAWPGDRFKRQKQAGWPQEEKKGSLLAPNEDKEKYGVFPSPSLLLEMPGHG